ncbi:MAG TPA: hypothetical protein VF221_22840, partial [Chloroflexota bacterium]
MQTFTPIDSLGAPNVGAPFSGAESFMFGADSIDGKAFVVALIVIAFCAGYATCRYRWRRREQWG